MREPNLDEEGWTLQSGEGAHAATPKTFWIPDRAARESLKIGDYAKLIFEMSLDNGSTAVERMWVILRETRNGRYFGRLDNEPDAIEANEEFWLGVEVPFGPEHIINIMAGDESSVALALSTPLRTWPRD